MKSNWTGICWSEGKQEILAGYVSEVTLQDKTHTATV